MLKTNKSYTHWEINKHPTLNFKINIKNKQDTHLVYKRDMDCCVAGKKTKNGPLWFKKRS